jgi:diguanylate cyclase (GGDEF)-like protein
VTANLRRPSRASRAKLLTFFVLMIVCAGALSVVIGFVATSSARRSGLDAAATVRQGDIEAGLWSALDAADFEASLAPGAVADLDRIVPTSFGARSSLVGAVLTDADGTPIWAWGKADGLAGVDADITSPTATMARSDESSVAWVTYRLPIRPPLLSDPVATLAATVADPDVAALGSRYPIGSMAVIVGSVLLAWGLGLALARGLLRQSWGETETQRRVAMIDPLTGLANRSALNERGGAAIANAHRQDGHVGLVLIDLNRFKAVNDTGGHALGDRVLVEVGRRLLEITRRGELAVRVGGDEFAVLVPVVRRRSELEALAVRVRAALEIPVRFSSAADVRVTASVGTAWSPVDGASIAELFKTADTLMYAEKNRVRVPLNDSIARAKELAAAPDGRTEADRVTVSAPSPGDA